MYRLYCTYMLPLLLKYHCYWAVRWSRLDLSSEKECREKLASFCQVDLNPLLTRTPRLASKSTTCWVIFLLSWFAQLAMGIWPPSEAYALPLQIAAMAISMLVLMGMLGIFKSQLDALISDEVTSVGEAITEHIHLGCVIFSFQSMLSLIMIGYSFLEVVGLLWGPVICIPVYIFVACHFNAQVFGRLFDQPLQGERFSEAMAVLGRHMAPTIKRSVLEKSFEGEPVTLKYLINGA